MQRAGRKVGRRWFILTSLLCAPLALAGYRLLHRRFNRGKQVPSRSAVGGRMQADDTADCESALQCARWRTLSIMPHLPAEIVGSDEDVQKNSLDWTLLGRWQDVPASRGKEFLSSRHEGVFEADAI